MCYSDIHNHVTKRKAGIHNIVNAIFVMNMLYTNCGLIVHVNNLWLWYVAKMTHGLFTNGQVDLDGHNIRLVCDTHGQHLNDTNLI